MSPRNGRLRILVAHSFYRQAGGEDRHVREQVELLRTAHDVQVVARENADLRGGLHAARQMAYSSRETDRVSAAIAGFRPDVVHLHNAYPSLGPAVHLAAHRSRVPLVMTVHNFRLRCPNGLMFTEGSVCRRCVGGAYFNAVLHGCLPSPLQTGAYASTLWLHRFALRLEDKVGLYIVPSSFMYRTLRSWGFGEDRLALVRHFTNVRDAPAPLGSVGLFVGRVSAEKGVDVLLRALRLAGDPPFVIVGDGPAFGDLRALATDLDLRRTRFLGYVAHPALESLVETARYVVVPSLSEESSGLVASEAMGAGRPVIGFGQGGLTELLEAGRGIPCSPGSASELAAAIHTFINAKGRAEEAGRLSHAYAAQYLSARRHVADLENAYHRALKSAM